MTLGILIVLALVVLLLLTVMAQSLDGTEPAAVSEPDELDGMEWKWPRRNPKETR